VGIPVHSTSDAGQADLYDFYRIKKNKKMEKKIWGIMDRFFTVMLLLSGEDRYEDTNISHIL